TRIILTHLDFFNAIEFKGLQKYGFKEEGLQNFSKDELFENVYSITSTGKILKGIDTYKKAFKYIPLLLPVGIFLSIPGIYHLGKRIYEKVAANRIVERCTEDNYGFTSSVFPVDYDLIKISKTFYLKDLRVKAIAIGIILLTLFQLNVTYNSGL